MRKRQNGKSVGAGVEKTLLYWMFSRTLKVIMPIQTSGLLASVKCCRWSIIENNSEDKFAIAIKRTGSVVGHVLFNLAPIVSAFLKRDIDKGLVEVTGSKIKIAELVMCLRYPTHIIFIGQSCSQIN